MLTATALTKAHGPRHLFRDVSIQLSSGRRIALVGGNGVGKTTLIEILLGIQDPDSGTVHRPTNLSVGYLPQELQEELVGSALEVTLQGAAQIVALERRLVELQEQLAAVDNSDKDQALREYGETQSRFEQLGGYAIESEAHRVLAGLGFDSESVYRDVRELSGGWQVRVALAKLLLAEPDVLILDEPTNHLDVDSVTWLEEQLSEWPGAILFVSHDRDFIDCVANRVIELDGRSSHEYVGGFSEFVESREVRVAQVEAAAAHQNRKFAETERFIERFRYMAKRGRCRVASKPLLGLIVFKFRIRSNCERGSNFLYRAGLRGSLLSSKTQRWDTATKPSLGKFRWLSKGGEKWPSWVQMGLARQPF